MMAQKARANEWLEYTVRALNRYLLLRHLREPPHGATPPFRLQRRILRGLMTEYWLTNGDTSLGRLALIRTSGGEQGNISHSLRPLETCG
jgi:hypothetical protein